MSQNAKTTTVVESCTIIEAGVCGFSCRIRARRTETRKVTLQIDKTECRQIRQMAQELDTITLQQLFAPATRNTVYLAAQQAGCHASCVVPAAVLKTAEVAMEMALPKPVHIRFEACVGNEDDPK